MEEIIYRDLPKGWSNFMSYHLYELSRATKSNLEQLYHLYNIEWKKAYSYDIGNRHGYIIIGFVNNKRVEYWRIETKSPSAGQTLVYYDIGKSWRMTILKDKTSQLYPIALEQLGIKKPIETNIPIKGIKLLTGKDINSPYHDVTLRAVRDKINELIHQVNKLIKA